MNRMKMRSFLPLALAFITFFVPALLIAQETETAAESQGPPATLAAPSWQKGGYWAKFDGKLLVDFGDLAHFRGDDLALGPPTAGQVRVVFMGDSITQGWNLQNSFPGKPYINRGISGQTSSQMLLRFRQDVIDLKPKVVVILAGTNDLAENTGPATLEQVEGNLMSMIQLAAANGIGVVLCPVLPSVRFWWHPGLQNPAPRIVALDKWIKTFAAEKGYFYADYYSQLADAAGGLPRNLSRDGVHPSPAGYAIMSPLVESGIKKTLKGM
jgi:lysophospholipase L1-like esterase